MRTFVRFHDCETGFQIYVNANNIRFFNSRHPSSGTIIVCGLKLLIEVKEDVEDVRRALELSGAYAE